MTQYQQHKLCVAPMMDWTDRHCRYFHRLLTRRALRMFALPGASFSVEVFEHGEGVRPDDRQERIGCPVEHLNRRHMRLEVPVIDELFDGLSVRHEGARYPLVPQAVGVADTVGAVQRTPLDVVQAESALAVLHDFTSTVGKSFDLFPAQQGNTGGHLTHSLDPLRGRTRFTVRLGA